MGGIVDNHFDNRAKNGTKKNTEGTKVTTDTLQRVLYKFGAPNTIDYLSLDVEGAESAVLAETFPWNRYTFLTLTIERPPPDLNNRLFRHGYLFVSLIGIADVAFVHASHPHASKISMNQSFVQVPAKCKSHGVFYSDRHRLNGVRCRSIFGCCAFPGFPQSTTRYLRTSNSRTNRSRVVLHGTR